MENNGALKQKGQPVSKGRSGHCERHGEKGSAVRVSVVEAANSVAKQSGWPRWLAVCVCMQSHACVGAWEDDDGKLNVKGHVELRPCQSPRCCTVLYCTRDFLDVSPTNRTTPSKVDTLSHASLFALPQGPSIKGLVC